MWFMIKSKAMKGISIYLYIANTELSNYISIR